MFHDVSAWHISAFVPGYLFKENTGRLSLRDKGQICLLNRKIEIMSPSKIKFGQVCQ